MFIFVVLGILGIPVNHSTRFFKTLRCCQNKGDPDISTVIWACDSLLRMLHRAQVFLTPAEQEHRQVIGTLFIQTYCKLASEAVTAKKKLWRTRPKFHLFDHMVSDSRPSLLNPVFGSTWMDEDAIKRWFRIKKRVHRRNATLNCLRRWLLALPGQLQKACERDN